VNEVTLEGQYKVAYKRQMEVYQWLLRRNGYRVSDTGYFVYCNGRADAAAFDAKLEFDITLIAHTGDDSWVEPTLHLIHDCLAAHELPGAGPDCDYCAYRDAVDKVTQFELR
jgi:hypothetical protein